MGRPVRAQGFDVNDGTLESLMRDKDGFRRLASYLKDIAGIDLPETPKNLSLMASRLRRIIMERGESGYVSYFKSLQQGSDELRREFISALTTNTTQFFREKEHFGDLERALPSLVEAKRSRGGNDLRIWCAAASTGQEPYTILMTVLELFAGRPSLPMKFLATDIDLEVLARAADGVYSEHEVQGIPVLQLQKYFVSSGSGGTRHYRVRDEFRAMIRFAQFNLIQPSYPFQHKFDVIFCRNVLIYFDAPTALGVVDRLSDQLEPGGLLFVGHSECGLSRSNKLITLNPAAYQKTGGTTLAVQKRKARG